MLEGISTQGKDNGYISQFTVIYSESSDGPLQPFVDVSKLHDNVGIIVYNNNYKHYIYIGWIIAYNNSLLISFFIVIYGLIAVYRYTTFITCEHIMFIIICS